MSMTSQRFGTPSDNNDTVLGSGEWAANTRIDTTQGKGFTSQLLSRVEIEGILTVACLFRPVQHYEGPNAAECSQPREVC